MKRKSGIFIQIVDFDNIIKAIHNSSKNKRDRDDVMKILNKPKFYARKIEKILKEGKFKPKYSKLRSVNDGIILKKREVCEPKYFPDQIIHWAIYQIITPNLNNIIQKTSCGSISGRGQIYAKNKIEKWFRIDKRGMKYCCKIDISKCYDSINHKVLFKRFKDKYKDERFLSLIKTIIQSYHSDVGKHNGIPIGWVTSQVFSMFYLTAIDNFLKHGNRYDRDKSISIERWRGDISHVIRYMDDICIFSSNKKSLHKILKKLHIFVVKYLDLKIKDNWQIFKVYRYNKRRGKFVGRKVDFVGFTMGFCRTGIRKSISLRILRRVRQLENGKYSLHNCLSYLSYFGLVKYSSSPGFHKRYWGNLCLKFIKSIIRQGMYRKMNAIYLDIDLLFKFPKIKLKKLGELYNIKE